jgi:autophagy-related protein 2
LTSAANVNSDRTDSTIPSAVDLAESFLQTEPEQDRVELETAILSESPEIGNSYASIEDGENDLPLGTGAMLSLPAFMARFLTGIIDRLQIKIRGVSLGLDVEIPNELSRMPSSSPADLVTIQLRVDDIDIEGVTHETAKIAASGDAATGFPRKKGKRLVCLSRIQGVFISEADTFRTQPRSSSTSSPSATFSDMFDERQLPARTPLSKRKSMSKNVDPDRLSTPSSNRMSSKSLPKNASPSPSLQGSAIANDYGRFDDAPEDEDIAGLSESLSATDLEDAVTDSVLRRSGHLELLTVRQSIQRKEQEGGRSMYSSLTGGFRSNASPKSPPSTPTVSNHAPYHLQSESEQEFSDSHPTTEGRTDSILRSTILPTRQHSRFSQGRVSQSQSSLPGRPYSPPVRAIYERTAPNIVHQTESTTQIRDDHGSSTPIGDNLDQSQIFSHEDAESMYMSAVSYGPPSDKITDVWTVSNVDSSGPSSELGATSHMLQADNSERGLHTTPDQTSSSHPYLSKPLASTSPALEESELTPSTLQTPSLRPDPPAPQNSRHMSERSATTAAGYNKTTKHVLNIDKIAIYLPGVANGSPPQPTSDNTSVNSTLYCQGDASQSTSMNIPGAFSTHLPARHDPTASRSPTEAPESKGMENVDTTIEVEVGRVATQVDVSVGTLIWMLVSRVKEALASDFSTSEPIAPISATSNRNLRLKAEQISIMFVEKLEGSLISIPSGSDNLPSYNPDIADVLLRSTIDGLCISSVSSSAQSTTAVTIRKFAFGYAKDNILSFDANLRMRASVRDLEASAGIDVSIDICRTAESTRFDVKTLPLQISIDLQKLDETFVWFGGLSSVLNLGSSIASNATITAPSPSKKRAHGVRFEVPISPDDKSLAAQNKADVRIGGFVLELIGTECSVRVDTSAVKIVSRSEGIGVGIQKIKLSGPHLNNAIEDPAIDIEVTATRAEYLPTPKDVDLDALLSLITPSKVKYDQDDDILLETLLRQRKQGAVLRLSADSFQSRISKLHELRFLPGLMEEISRLSTVAKYLPDDDRPGLLSLITLNKFESLLDVGHSFGILDLTAQSIEIAQITFPTLTAFSVNSISARRNSTEELLGIATDPDLREPRSRAPAIMARMIGDEMEPIVKIKLWNLKFEYRVPTLMAILDVTESLLRKDHSGNLSASIATFADLARSTVLGLPPKEETQAKKSSSSSKPMTFDMVLRDCVCGLNPLGLTSKVLVVLTETHLSAVLPNYKEFSATAELSKASLLVIDNVANIRLGNRVSRPRRQSFDGGSSQAADLCAMGFVSVSYISSAKAIALVSTDGDGDQSINVELRDDLFVLETCADSTQTLIATLNGLMPPSPPSKDIKYRTKVIPVEDLLASLSGNAFGTAEGDYNFEDDFDLPGIRDISGEELDDFDFDSHYYQPPDDQYGTLLSEETASSASTQLTTKDTHDGVLLESFLEPEDTLDDDSTLEFEDNYFGTSSILDGTAHKWNSTKNTYDRSNTDKVRKSPLKICVRQVHIIWNLFDGYDWQHTRETISKAVQDVESKAIEKRARYERRPAFEQDVEDSETVIGDFLFNSIYIGIPANRDPRELTTVINQELNDNATETESIATTSLSASPSRQGIARANSKQLRLKRSKHHKITFELKGVCADFVAFPPGSGETQSSIDIRVHDFEIFDHVPTSTWRKFATYMQDAGERETGSGMIHLEILNVKPIPDLSASEMVVKATVLPLRLHVDQDALDFITRFFEFKDSSSPANSSPGEAPFFQRVEVNSVQVKLDFKPKRVDYAGLRSGHTTEFMNFLILDEADMVLRHTIIYGVSGFEKLGKTLNDIWMPDIKRNQLPGILAGLAPVRSIVNVSGGLRHLVLVPIREYQKDGRIVRSISKGAAAFAKTTGTELVKLGAKVAIGVQTVLQGAEGLLNPAVETSKAGMQDGDEDEETKQISLYANQPVGVLQGIRGGYNGLQRDLVLARDAIIAVPGEVMEGGNAAGVLRAVRKHAPTVILRPAIGVAKAGGQVLMGATNALDPANLQRADAVS